MKILKHTSKKRDENESEKTFHNDEKLILGKYEKNVISTRKSKREEKILFFLSILSDRAALNKAFTYTHTQHESSK